MENTKSRTIYSMRLAGYLMLSGFICHAMGRNEKDLNKFTYFFNKSEAIEKAIEDYINSRRKS